MGEEKDYHPRHIMSMFSHVQIFATPWTEAHQASLSFTISWRLIKFMSIDLVMLSNYFILCHPLLLLPSIFPNIRISFNELALHIKRPKYWSFSFSISPCISTTIPKHQFFSTHLLYGSTLTSIHDYWKTLIFDYMDFSQRSDVSAF